jgi:hypothetical protein
VFNKLLLPISLFLVKNTPEVLDVFLYIGQRVGNLVVKVTLIG